MTFSEPDAEEGSATYLYDPSTGVSAFPSRWDNAVPAVPHPQHDQRIDGERAGLTFLTDVLDQPLTFAGPLMLRLHAATQGVDGGDAPTDDQPPILDQLLPPYHDTDFVVKVSDVASDGTAHLLTEGFLRASHRAVDTDRSQVVDGEVVVPFHPHTRDTLQPPVPGEVNEYLIEVWPTAKTLRSGHRLRVDLYSADTPNHLNLLRPAVTTVSLDETQPSYLLLPVTSTDTGERQPDTTPELGVEPDPDLPATGTGTAIIGPLLLTTALLLRHRRGRSQRDRRGQGR
jgi:predicted acyl esterase